MYYCFFGRKKRRKKKSREEEKGEAISLLPFPKALFGPFSFKKTDRNKLYLLKLRLGPGHVSGLAGVLN